MEGCSQVPNKNLQQKFRMIHLGLIPGAGNLGKLFIWMKIHGLMNTHKAFGQMAKWLDWTSGHNEQGVP